MNEIHDKKAVVFVIIAMMIIGTLPLVFAWEPGDEHKMHFPQLPDEEGWAVYATAGLSFYGYPEICLADDWLCSETGPITDIHFWGAWKGDIEGNILAFVVAIAEDIPASQNPDGFSKPGVTLWERTFEFWGFDPRDPPTMEGWYNPYWDEVIYPDHQAYFQYDIVDIPAPFYQEAGTIYWLSISAIVEHDPAGLQPLWGWKSSVDHWNDDAVWAEWYVLDWVDLWEPKPPSDPIVNDFWVAIDPNYQIIQELSGGIDYYDDGMGTSINGWYYYQNTEWWNIWFYDHEFNSSRYKEITIWFDAFLLNPEPAWIEVAVNWATDEWSAIYPPFPPPPPPIPPLTPTEEDMYIGRHTLFQGDCFEGHYEFSFVIPDYNPEWVSVDVRGFNFIIPMGQIIHDCLPKPQSLDLAFVITSCIPDIDVEKYVWNDGWIDADTINEAVDIPIGTDVEFLITIHNTGNCDLTDIYVYDSMDASMQFINADPYPNEVIDYPHGTELYWYFPGPLPPCNWINISVFAEVVGPADSIDENYVYAEGYCLSIHAWDDDSAFVHAIELTPPSIEIDKTVWDNDLQAWVDSIEAEICTIIRFNLSIHNTGLATLIVTKVRDILPPCLAYADSATVNGYPHEPDNIIPPIYEWNYLLPADYWYPGSEPGELPPGEWIYIEFDAHVISEDVNINEACVEAQSDGGPVADCDTATVIVIPGGPDIIPPEIIGLTLTASTPLDVNASFGWENITCIVTDDETAVDTVQLNITAPSPQIIPMAPIGGDVFFCNISLTNAGNYTYHVWANDTSNNQNTSASELFSLPMNEDVNKDGCVEFWDLVAISLVYGDVGTPGWCREDVNNGGMVEFWDLVVVSLVYGDCWF